MTIDEAVESLQQKLGDPEVFIVTHDGESIRIAVNFIYRADEAAAIGDEWEGYPIKRGRVSCW